MANDPRGRMSNMRILGRTGLNRQGGYVYEEQLRSLSGSRGAKVYAEMRDNDAVIGAFLFMIEMLVRQVKWTVKPSSEEKVDADAAEFIEECRQDMSHTWEDLMSEILSMVVFGWSYFELVYKRRQGPSKDPTKRSRYTDGKIGWRKIEIRAQETLDEWDFDDDGGIKGMWQSPPPDYGRLYIPIEKALLFRTKSTKNNPEGRSLLRSSHRAWFFKKRFEELEAIGAERDLVGIPKLEVPPLMMMDDAPANLVTLRGQLEQMGAELRRDERQFVMMPAEEYSDGPDGETIKSGYKLSLIQGGGQRQVDTDVVIRRYRSEIAMTVMAQFMLLGQDKVGSFSLASESTEIFAVAIGAILDSIAAVFNRYAIPRLLEVNNMQVEEPPELVPGDIEKPNLEAFAKFLETVVKAGVVIPGPALERHVRQVAELPDMEEDEEGMELDPRRNPAPQPEPKKPEPKPEPEEPEVNDDETD